MPNHHKNQRRREKSQRCRDFSGTCLAMPNTGLQSEEKNQEYKEGYIKLEYYSEIEQEFRKEWEDKFGISLYDTSNSFFTFEEQVNRYYENFCFWERRSYMDSLDNKTGKEFARSFLASNKKRQLLDKLRTNPKEIQEGVWKRLREEGCKLDD
jgi:hypothetical protein